MPGERRPKGNTEVPPFTQDEGVKRMREAHRAFLRARETAHRELEREEKQTGKFKRPALIAALKEEVKRLDTLKKDMDWYVSSPVAWTSLGTPTFRVKRETPRKKGVLEQAGRVVGKALVDERPTNVLGEKIGEDPGTTRLMTREEFNTFIARVENEAAFRNPITHADKEMIAVARPKGVWKPEKDEKPKKEERVKKPEKVIEVQTTPVPETGRGRLKREVTPAYTEPEVEAPLPAPARERIPEKDLQQLSEEEYAFDAKIQATAERVVRYGGKPDKERKMFFKALDKRMRILPMEALATFKELGDRFVSGEDVTESELIFAAMDHFRAKYSGVAESEVEQEMVYEATRTVVNQAIKDRKAGQAQSSQTKRPHVGDDYQRGYTIKPGKKKNETEPKKSRFPWIRSTLAAIATVFAVNAVHEATTNTGSTERPTVSRANEDHTGTASVEDDLAAVFGFNTEPAALEYAADPNYDGELQNPSTNQPYPAEEGYAPAPRVSATEAANDASGETTVTPYTVPEPIDPSAEAGQ